MTVTQTLEAICTMIAVGEIDHGEIDIEWKGKLITIRCEEVKGKE